MSVLLAPICQHIAVGSMLQRVGKGEPCAEVAPVAVVGHHRHRCLTLHHLIIKTIGRILIIMLPDSVKSRVIHITAGDFEQISQAESKDSSVP